MTAKLDELLTFFRRGEIEAALYYKEYGESFVTPCRDEVRDLLHYAAKLLHDLQDREKRIARLEAENETLTEGFKSIDSSLGHAMDCVDQDAKRIAELEARLAEASR